MPFPDRISVVTGDLIRSSEAPAPAIDAAMQVLSAAAGEIARWISADTRFTRFRGDGWQIVLPQRSDLGLRAAIFLVARLRSRKGGLMTRIALAEGAAVSLGTRDLSDAAGQAFALSGRALEGMKGVLAFAAHPPPSALELGFLDLLGPLLARWTAEQAEAVSLGLAPEPPPQKDIARRLDISEQAVSLRLRGAHDHALRNALRHWEDARRG